MSDRDIKLQAVAEQMQVVFNTLSKFGTGNSVETDTEYVRLGELIQSLKPDQSVQKLTSVSIRWCDFDEFVHSDMCLNITSMFPQNEKSVNKFQKDFEMLFYLKTINLLDMEYVLTTDPVEPEKKWNVTRMRNRLGMHYNSFTLSSVISLELYALLQGFIF